MAFNRTEIALAAWASSDRAGSGQKTYFQAVATARYVIRKVLRIVDEAARESGFDPLVHQALIQIFGSAEPLTIGQLAERLDIVPAFTSRIIRDLEASGLVERRRVDRDRRVIRVVATKAAAPVLAEINERVELHANVFHRQLSDDEREAALVVFAFFVGIAADSAIGRVLSSQLKSNSPGSSRPKNRQRTGS